jgi:hypothetical protein
MICMSFGFLFLGCFRDCPVWQVVTLVARDSSLLFRDGGRLCFEFIGSLSHSATHLRMDVMYWSSAVWVLLPSSSLNTCFSPHS